MNFENYKVQWRGLLLVLGLFTQIRQQIDQCFEDNFALICLSRNKYLSNQVNYMIIIWLALFILWRNNDENLNKLTGKVYGAIVSYITLVWLAYWALLSATDTSVGWDLYTNIIIHYVYPIAFIVDWIIFEKARYNWDYYPRWLMYPLIYLGFVFVNGTLGLDLGYIYGFMDLNTNTTTSVITMIIALIFIYTLIAVIFIVINRKLNQEASKLN